MPAERTSERQRALSRLPRIFQRRAFAVTIYYDDGRRHGASGKSHPKNAHHFQEGKLLLRLLTLNLSTHDDWDTALAAGWLAYQNIYCPGKLAQLPIW